MIESKDNKKIKYLNKLRKNKYIYEENKFIIEGKHLVEEAYNSGILLETYSTYDCNYGVINTIVSDNVMSAISYLPSKPDVIGVCKLIEENNNFGNRIIILDNVQDPGNVGTIIRSAKAFNFDTVVLSLDSVNKYNEKLIRASQGMFFKTNIVTKDLKYFIPYIKNEGYNVYGTDVVNGVKVNSINDSKIAVVMGNEGTGITLDIKKLLDKNIYIDINSKCESLNVSVAASIIMYEINKGE